MALVKTIAEEQVDESGLFSLPETCGFVVCKNPNKIKLLIDELKENSTVFYVSDGDFSMHDLVIELLKKYHPAEVFITTYALREFSVRQLVMAMDRGEITAVNMLLDLRAPVRTPEVYQLANMNFSRICLTNIHAKVTVLRSAKGCVTIVGSQNWTSNPKIEAGVVSTQEDLAAFQIDWITKTMDNGETFK
jgi:hypothetical protein